MKFANALFIAPLLALLSLPALADKQGQHYRFNGYAAHRSQPAPYDAGARRQHRSEVRTFATRARFAQQARRIHQGRLRGELTRNEAYRLHQQQRRLRTRFHHYSRDGFLSAGEYRRLNGMLERNSQRIAHFRHNDRYEPRHLDGRTAWNRAQGRDVGSYYRHDYRGYYENDR